MDIILGLGIFTQTVCFYCFFPFPGFHRYPQVKISPGYVNKKDSTRHTSAYSHNTFIKNNYFGNNKMETSKHELLSHYLPKGKTQYRRAQNRLHTMTRRIRILNPQPQGGGQNANVRKPPIQYCIKSTRDCRPKGTQLIDGSSTIFCNERMTSAEINLETV